MKKNQADIAPGKFDVVVDPYAWCEMLLFFAVSASTGYSPDLGMRQYKEGRSYLSGRLGEKIVCDNISIDDDAYHPSQAVTHFDADGCQNSIVAPIANEVLRNRAASPT